MKQIEFLTVVIFIVFLLRACNNQTSLPYEAGKEYKEIKSEFMRGLQFELLDNAGSTEFKIEDSLPYEILP
jgi:hypothetical protein